MNCFRNNEKKLYFVFKIASQYFFFFFFFFKTIKRKMENEIIYDKMLKPSLTLPINNWIPDNEFIESIIITILSKNIDFLQFLFSGNEKYNLIEFKRIFIQILKDPPIFFFNPKNPTFEIPFTIEEDFELINFIKNKNEFTNFNDLNNYCPSIKPIHSINSILKRINYLKNNNKNNEIIKKYSEEILLEELFYLSIENKQFNDFSCLKFNNNIYNNNNNLNEEINDLLKNLQFISRSSYLESELAILRFENNYFLMKKSRIIIGRNNNKFKVDIDLSLINQNNCIHYSRQQLIISLLEDLNFYLENIGNQIIRVNGIIIPKNGICKLETGSLIDISDNLFLFIINNFLINEIKKDFNKLINKKFKKLKLK